MHVLSGIIKHLGSHVIFSDGRLYSNKKNKFLKPHVTAAGYFRIKMGSNNHLLHRLVAQAFIPNPENKPEVNHVDGNKLNHAVSNLEWVTPHENVLHSYQAGLASKKGSKNVKALISENDVLVIRRSSMPRREIAECYGISLNTVWDILAKRTWTHV